MGGHIGIQYKKETMIKREKMTETQNSRLLSFNHSQNPPSIPQESLQESSNSTPKFNWHEIIQKLSEPPPTCGHVTTAL